MARRRTASRSSKKSSKDFPWAWVAVGGVAAVGAYLLYTRSAPASALPATTTGTGALPAPPTTPLAVPPLQTTPASTSGSSSGTGVPVAGAGPTAGPPSSATPLNRLPLPQRLQQSASARKTYFFQATLYSAGLTNEVPDGLVGAKTRAMLAGVWSDSGLRNPPSTVTDDAIKFLPNTINVHRAQERIVWRVVPDRLSQTLIDKINGEMAPLLAQAGSHLVLQANAA